MTKEQIAEVHRILKKMAHDVRTPMTSVLGFTQLMLGDEMITGENREYLELMESDIEKLNQTILEALAQIDENMSEA